MTQAKPLYVVYVLIFRNRGFIDCSLIEFYDSFNYSFLWKDRVGFELAKTQLKIYYQSNNIMKIQNILQNRSSNFVKQIQCRLHINITPIRKRI